MADSPPTGIDTPTIFTAIGRLFDHATATFVSEKVATLIDAIYPVAVIGVSLYLTCYGYLILSGKIQDPFRDFVFKSVKISFITAIALNAPEYSDFVVQGFNSLQNGLAEALGHPSNNSSIFGQLDTALGTGLNLCMQCIQKIANVKWYQFGQIFCNILAGLIVAAGTMALVIVGGVIVLSASMLLKITLAIGPLFIMCLMWPVTAKFFDAWFGQVLTYILKIVLVAVTISFAVDVFNNTLTPIDLSNDSTNLIIMALEILVVCIVMYYVLKDVVGLASGLAGGISMSVIGISQMADMAKSAGKVGSAARNVVDPVSTRRDLQSGMMTTARRSNHMIAGNTVWNPAYSQHVLKNMGRNWGWAKGGKVKEK